MRRVSLSPARVSAGQSSLKILSPASALSSPHSSRSLSIQLTELKPDWITAPLLEILEVVDMTMIDDVNGDGDTMVFNTKKGGGGEREEKGGVHPSTLVPGGEGVALQIGMPGPRRLGVEGVAWGGVLQCPRCTCWALHSHLRQPVATSPET